MTIEFTREVVFRDSNGGELRKFKVGDRTQSTAKVGPSNCFYFITTWGGVFDDEAVEVTPS